MARKVNVSQLSLFPDYVIEDDMIYFPLANYNALCRGNLLNNNVEIIQTFPDAKADQRYICIGIYKMESYLLCYIYGSKDIIVYDILRHDFSKLFCNKEIDFNSDTVFEKNDYIYIVSSRVLEIYKIDLQKKSIQGFTCDKYTSDDVQMGRIVRNGNYIYIPLYSEKIMITFELEKEEFEWYSYPENVSVIYNVACRNKELWIIGEDRKIYKWNIKDGKAGVCAEFPEDIELHISEIRYLFTFINRDILWMFPPLKERAIIKYNILTKQFKLVKISGEEMQNYTYGCETVKNIGNKAFWLSTQERILYEVDLITSNIQKHYFTIANIYNGQLYPPPVDGKMFDENYINAFEVMMKVIMEYNMHSMEKKRIKIGEAINEYINSLIY